MAYFGINGVGNATTATTATDTLRFISDTSVLSANSVLGMDGADLLILGAQGRTGVQSARSTLAVAADLETGSGTFTLQAILNGQDVAYTGTLTHSGLGGNGATTGVAITGVVTSQAGVRTVGGSNFYGNAGNDTIALGSYSGVVSTYTSTTFGGGAGSDLIGTLGYVADLSATTTAGTASIFEKNFFEGGGNADTINIQVDSATFSSNTIQGSQGNDTISFVTNNARVAVSQSNLIAGGGGADNITGTFAQASANTINGGGGNDALNLNFNTGGSNQIYLDVQGTDQSFDGNDILTAVVASGVFSANTIYGGAGNDTIHIQNATGVSNSNVYYLNAGDDIFSARNLSADSLYGGAGNDSIVIGGANTGDSEIELSFIKGGGGDDTIQLTTNAQTGTAVGGSTVVGGLGTDIFTASAIAGSTAVVGVTFQYDSLLDSTISNMDVVNGFDSDETGLTRHFYSPGGASLGSFSGAGHTATNGVVIFSGTFNDNVTARAEAISNAATAGNAFTFKSNAVSYLFVAGSTSDSISDDLLVQVGTAGSANAGQTGVIAIAGGKTITLTNFD